MDKQFNLYQWFNNSSFQINFNSENVPGCSNFDVDKGTLNVKCVTAGFNVRVENVDKNVHKKSNYDDCMWANTKCTGPLVPLGSHYGTPGIP